MGEIVEPKALETEALNQKLNDPNDLFKTYMVTSTKLRQKMITIYHERLEEQRKVLQKKMNLDRDALQKQLYIEYIDRVSTIEKEAVDKLNRFSLEREAELANDKEELYTYFDKARKELEKWKENPERYQNEMEYLNKKESMKIEAIEANALNLFEKSQKMFEDIISVFYEHDTEIKAKLG
ncbi:MAG: hypothetical protein K0U38_04995 [Epsilonproteobacteria bacterium]|nr:hypothetical protein [Campylobacterota bacterium]